MQSMQKLADPIGSPKTLCGAAKFVREIPSASTELILETAEGAKVGIDILHGVLLIVTLSYDFWKLHLADF